MPEDITEITIFPMEKLGMQDPAEENRFIPRGLVCTSSSF